MRDKCILHVEVQIINLQGLEKGMWIKLRIQDERLENRVFEVEIFSWYQENNWTN